jgi:peptidoglycan/xylan/chitin deacetylase (PgdA/CDA1 family)
MVRHNFFITLRTDARTVGLARCAALLCATAVVSAAAHALPRQDARAGAVTQPARPSSSARSAAVGPRTPNEMGRIPILEWHQVVAADGTYKVSRDRFRAELAELHARGYVPVNLSEMLDKKIDIPAGKSPVLFTFDDASPSQFRYIERNGALVVDPSSAVGILLDFIKSHPDWKAKGLFCALPAAEAGHAFFGDKGIDGQKTEWRFPKLKFLVQQGFELCNHTLWHAKLSKYSDAVVQEQFARGAMAIDSAVPGYTVRGMALPYGLWPKNRALTQRGSWYDKKSKRQITYSHDAVFQVAGGPARSPHDPEFNAKSLPRVPLQGGTKLTPTLDEMDKPGSKWSRYVSDGNPQTIAKP